MKRVASLVLSVACSSTAPRGLSAPGTHPSVDIALARARARHAPAGPEWIPLRANAFERATAERRLVLFDGAAGWCHWCHVMDETTWRDPAVLALLRARFVATREDVDARPDLAARYAAWGWPATVIFDARGRELARYRGYLSPSQMRAALQAALDDPRPLDDPSPAARDEVSLSELLDDALDQMDRAYDPALGGWGATQKVALGDNLQVELLRAEGGDSDARGRAQRTLVAQRALYDPVWGGVYQYSAGQTWRDPHFERLMPFQRATILAAVRGAEVLRSRSFLDDARAIAGFIVDHLGDERGAFHGAMDADINAHDRDARFIDGHVYFALDDAGRRRLGAPRVDPGAHPRDNGMAIEALAALYDATHEGRWIDAARRAAARMLSLHVDPEGRVTRAGTDDRLLADAAWLSLGLSALATSTQDPATARRAARILRRAMEDFACPEGLRDALRAHPLPGALSRVDAPMSENLAAVRAMARLAALDADGGWRGAGEALLRRTLTSARVRSQGRFVGETLVTAHALGVLPAFVRREVTVDAGDGATLRASIAPEGAGATLRVELRAGRAHVNRAFPTVLRMRGRDALRPSLDVRDDGVRAALSLPRLDAPSRVSGVLRWAACSDTTCVPVETAFRVRLGL